MPRPFFAIFYNDVYEFKLPPNHRFPMEKYRQVRKRVQSGLLARRRQQQQSETRAHDDDPSSASFVDVTFGVSPRATKAELATTHSRDYIQRFLTGQQTVDEIRNVGFPWSEQGVARACSSVGGTVAAAVAVLREVEQSSSSVALVRRDDDDHNHNYEPVNSLRRRRRLCWGAHIAGGTHHAFYDRGEGFCVFSDIAVAANVVLQRFPDTVRRILILDLDVHQGNGNAVLFQNRPEVFTFSLHCSANYFSEKQASDLDIEVPADCNDETYLLTLRHWLKQIRQKAGTFDLVFFQAGVDISEHDRLGRMKITAQGIQRRNQLVFDFVANDLGQVPMVITMGGGYPQSHQWEPILEAHANVYLQAHDYLADYHAKERQDQAANCLDEIRGTR